MVCRFNAARLKEARLLRGLSQTEVADLLDVTKQAVSQYENGVVVPRGDIEIKMAEILNMPLTYFSMQDSNAIKTPIFFRSRKTSAKKMQNKYRIYINWVVDIYLYISDKIKLPKAKLIKKCQEKYSLDEIAAVAKELRAYWGLGNGPISNLTLLLENNGFIIAKIPMHFEKVDACSVFFTNIDREKNRPMIFLTSNISAVRLRRDLAHELGHQVLHSWMDEETLEANRDDIEKEAELFASCFLMPTDAMEREAFSVVSADSLLYLKQRWGASAQSILYHLRDLDLIKNALFDKLRNDIYRRRWRNHEPFDDKIAQEKPELIKDAIKLLVDAGVKTAADIADDISFPVNDLAELCGIPKDFFQSRELEKPMLRLVK